MSSGKRQLVERACRVRFASELLRDLRKLAESVDALAVFLRHGYSELLLSCDASNGIWTMWRIFLLLSLACTGCRGVWHEDSGPWVIATKGELFPRAAVREVLDGFLVLRPSLFQFVVSKKTCNILDDAIDRYKSIIIKEARIALIAALPSSDSSIHQDVGWRGDLTKLVINLVNPCESLPYLGMNENYTLEIDAVTTSAYLNASDIWGVLRGLESFSQLLAPSIDGHLTIKAQRIADTPRFPHRGLLLDTSRHFIPVSDILLTLDAMSYNKMNVLHWHIVDDNSFPYVSTAFPELSAKGAYHPTMIYSPTNVRKIIEYARLRGIRVLPEFDTPAHSKCWGLSHPELLTECYENGKPNGKLGPMNPTKANLFPFLEALFGEIFQVFPDRYTHLGGDEIDFDCWASNPRIIEYMQQHGYKDGDFKALEADYFRNMLQIPKAANVSSIVWQEVFSNVKDLSPETVVQIWTGAWEMLMIDVVSKNHPAILSACWYLDALQSGGDWLKYYHCDPTNFVGTPAMKSLVLGGEACMWGEFVDRTNLHSRIWPRASAAAERLWSLEKDLDTEAAKRLEEHACRMNRRGIPAQPPNGSGFCVA